MGSQYAGNPNSYPTNIIVPDDSDTPNAATFDPPFEGLADRTAALKLRVFGGIGTDWQPRMANSVTGFTAVMGASFYVTPTPTWLVCVGVNTGTGTCNVMYTQGLGDGDWNAVDNGSGIGTGGVIFDAIWNGTVFLATHVLSSDKSLRVYKCTPGGAWTAVITNAAVAYVRPGFYAFGGNSYVFKATDSVSTVNIVAYSPDGTTWTSAYNASFPADEFLVADNGTMMVAVTRDVTGNYLTGSLSSWASNSPQWGGTYPQGLAWCIDRFVLVTNTAPFGLGSMQTYQSFDGFTWTQVGSTLTGGFAAVGICALGPLLVGITMDAGSNGSWTIYSLDQGETWYQSQRFFPHVSSPLMPPRIRGSNGGFLGFTTNHMSFSHPAGGGQLLT